MLSTTVVVRQRAPLEVPVLCVRPSRAQLAVRIIAGADVMLVFYDIRNAATTSQYGTTTPNLRL